MVIYASILIEKNLIDLEYQWKPSFTMYNIREGNNAYFSYLCKNERVQALSIIDFDFFFYQLFFSDI